MSDPLPPPAANHKFTTLDALRGVAAIAVILYHSGTLSAHLFRHAYLAVDFFFVLSGFVLSYAYGERFQHGWPLRKFLRVRFIRLFPLSTLGLTLGLLVALAHAASPPVHEPLQRWPAIFLLNLFFLPAHLTDPARYLFPFNPVAWSLFFELFSNVVHATLLRRARVAVLVPVAVLTGAAFLSRVVAHGTADVGHSNLLQPDGYLRVLFSYTVGMLLFRLWRSGRLRIATSPALVCILLLALLAVPLPKQAAGLADALMILLPLPAIVWAGASGREGTRYAHVLQALGASSYGIYILQAPLLSTLNFAWVRMLGHSLAEARPWPTPLVLCVVIGAAIAADRYFDVPLRQWLKNRKTA